jgi:hypothetical protein
LHVDINPHAVLDIIRLLGSVIPTPDLSLRFTNPTADFTPYAAVSPWMLFCSQFRLIMWPSKSDFVSAVQQYHQTAVTLRINAIEQALDLDGISVDKDSEVLTGTGLDHDYYRRQRFRQVVLIAHALASGMPRLKNVELGSRVVRHRITCYQWRFAISRDGLGQVNVCSVRILGIQMGIK